MADHRDIPEIERIFRGEGPEIVDPGTHVGEGVGPPGAGITHLTILDVPGRDPIVEQRARDRRGVPERGKPFGPATAMDQDGHGKPTRPAGQAKLAELEGVGSVGSAQLRRPAWQRVDVTGPESSSHQLLAEHSQLCPRLGVVGLRLRLPRLQLIEEGPRRLGGRHGVHHRLDPLRDGRTRLDLEGQRHRGAHRRRRVERVGQDPFLLERRSHVDRHHHLGELALGVTPPSVVALCHHHIVEVDGRLGARRHVDDSRRGAGGDQREQPLCQEVVGQVVHREVHLIPLGAELPRAVEDEAHPRVVDEDIEALGVAHDRVGKAPHLIERGKVGPVERGAPLAALRDFVDQRVPPRGASPGDQNVRAGGGNTTRHVAAKSVGGAGDEDHLSRQVGERRGFRVGRRRLLRRGLRRQPAGGEKPAQGERGRASKNETTK